MEFPTGCAVYCYRGINVNSLLSVEKVRKCCTGYVRRVTHDEIADRIG
jgi:hypothetical protein